MEKAVDVKVKAEFQLISVEQLCYLYNYYQIPDLRLINK